jgi:iron complex outermembrane recepter protein
MNLYSARNIRAALVLVLGTGLSYLAVGQTASTAAPATDETVKMSKFVVTGSYIPAAADEAKALPVQVVDLTAIQNTGVNTNVLDVLRKTIPQIQGGNNIGTENANISGGYTNGGSMVQLRNIDTLVLVDGKRMAPSAVAASGSAGTGIQFVDLNLIPLAAIERIEVLTDGASAVYGSDAVSGVINIILRKDFEGVEIGGHMTMTPKDTGGYWRERSIYAVAGGGNAKTHLMFTAEWSKSQPLWERDVSYDNPYYGTASYPGVINDASGNFYRLKPGLNAPTNSAPMTLDQLVAAGIYVPSADVASGFNLSAKPTILNASQKRIATVTGSHQITDQVKLSAEFLYANTELNYQLNPQPVTASNDALIGYGVSPISGPSKITVRNRFIYGPNRIYDNVNNFYRMTTTLEDKVNDYINWQVYGTYNISYQTAYGFNQILNSALLTGLQNGNINLFAIQQDPTRLAQANIFGTSIGDYRSELYTLNAQAYGKVWDLPAGPIEYAAGAEYRKEKLNATADYNSIIPPGASTSLWNNGTSLSPFDNQRHMTAYFGELKVPVTSPKNNIPGLHLLTLDGAYRHESYSDGNKTSVPKLSLRYLPFNDELALRATYAKSFTAPTLYDLYGPSSSGFTSSPTALERYDSSGNDMGVKWPNLQGHQINGFNPHLTPSHAKSNTFGVVYSPKYAKGLEVTVDYYKIEQKDLIGSPGGTLTMMQSVERYGPASPFAQYVTLGNFAFSGGTHVTSPGQLSSNPDNVYVIQSLVNIAEQKQHGWDINARYMLPWEKYGRVIINSSWALVSQWFVKSGPTDPGFDYAGTDAYPGTEPKTRSYSTIDWTYKSYGATLGYTHINSVDSGYGNKVNPYNTFDIQFRFDLGRFDSRFKGVSFDLGCNNFTNQKPPLDRDNWASPPFDASTYSYFGRSYYADVKYKF